MNVAGEADVRGGRAIILRSSFISSPRFMSNLYQNALATVKVFGKPDLFITFTCNPDWPEIVQNIKRYHKVEFRHDIVNRVVKGKLDAFLHDILKNDIFGKVMYYSYSIEFQKRGLPHCDILLCLYLQHKLKTPQQIDKVISAEIPDPDIDHQLYETLTKNLIHGPCGTINPQCVCMQNNSAGQ